MAKQDKIIAFFLIFQSVVGGAIFAGLAAYNDLPFIVWAICVPLIICALAAGVGSLKRLSWAAVLGMIVFAVQTPIIATPSFHFYAWLGVRLDIAATWQGQARIGVNLVGLGMLVWSAARYYSSDNSFKN